MNPLRLDVRQEIKPAKKKRFSLLIRCPRLFGYSRHIIGVVTDTEPTVPVPIIMAARQILPLLGSRAQPCLKIAV
jgi:hypothetical protein